MSKENKKLTQEEIKSLTELKDQFDDVVGKIGVAEAQIMGLDRQKQTLNSELIALQEREKVIAQKLEQKYGRGRLSLDTGEIVPL